MTFLRADAGPEVLLRACAHNHLVWAQRQARAAGGTTAESGGVHIVYLPLPQPEVVVAVLDPPGPSARTVLDELLRESRSAALLSVWAVREADTGRLGPWLGARGGRWGGRPHWMALDLFGRPQPPPAPDLAARTGITFPDRFDDHVVPELPCYHPDLSALRQTMAEQRPQQIWHAIQWSDRHPVGQVSLNVTEGELGVIGLHELIWLSSARVRGPGLERLDVFVRFALDHGCRYLVINAAEHIGTFYRAMGFRSLGRGQTWWFTRAVLAGGPSAEEVAFAEAIGAGRLDGSPGPARPLDRPLANGMTPLQFAARTARAESARWLLEHGARPDLLAYWDLGWRAEAARLAGDEPGLLHEQRPRSGKTLLHQAVERADAELTAVLLAAGCPTGSRDNEFGATPLEWATELRRPTIAELLRRAGG